MRPINHEAEMTVDIDTPHCLSEASSDPRIVFLSPYEAICPKLKLSGPQKSIILDAGMFSLAVHTCL